MCVRFQFSTDYEMIINVWMCPPGSLLRIHVGAGPHAETDVQVAPGLHGWPVDCHAANLRAYRDRDPPTCCFARHRGAVQCRGSLLSGSLPSRLLLHVHLSPSVSTFLRPLPLPPARPGAHCSSSPSRADVADEKR